MPYEIHLEEDQQLVVLRIFGESAISVHDAARRDVGQICRKAGYRQILVDLRDAIAHNVLSMVECYEFGARHHRTGNADLPYDSVIATVLPSSPDDGHRPWSDVP